MLFNSVIQEFGHIDAIVNNAGTAIQSPLNSENWVNDWDKTLNTNLRSSAAMVNGTLHSFISAVVLEIKNGIRVNAVSLGMVEDSYERYAEFFPGHHPIPMNKVVNAYSRSVNGRGNGEIIKIYS